MQNMDRFGAGLVTVFMVLSLFVRVPLAGFVIILSGLVLPFPKFMCEHISTNAQCGVAPALSIGLEEDVPMFWRIYMTALCILIPLGMEQSRSRRELYDLKESLSFYKAYHSNPINEAIHLVCIPTILWSTIGLYSFTTPVFGQGTSTPLDWSAFVAIVYAQVPPTN